MTTELQPLRILAPIRLIRWLLHYANASPPMVGRRQFYELKNVLLWRYAKHARIDLQEINASVGAISTMTTAIELVVIRIAEGAAARRLFSKMGIADCMELGPIRVSHSRPGALLQT